MVPSVAGILLVVLVAVNGQQNYCTLCRDHTMCLYQGIGAKCSPRLAGGVTQADRVAILDSLNAFRQRVTQGQETRGAPGPQPPAANMRLVTWSNELATVAQRWADQCDFKMDKCRSLTSQRHVGQTIHKNSVTGNVGTAQWPTVVTKWTDYVKNFNKANVDSFVRTGNHAGLYAQIAWANTYQVGCGYTVHKDSKEDKWTHQFYVCNFAPGGNIEAAAVYKKGRACSACPAGTSCSNRRFPGLCA